MKKVVKEILWLWGLDKELKVQDQIVTIYYDNNNAIQLSKNQQQCYTIIQEPSLPLKNKAH